MPALKALPVVAEHQRTGRHQLPAGWGPVLKAACQDDRDRVARMPFFEGMIARAARADDVSDRPAFAARDDTGRRTTSCPVLPAAGERVLEVDRNFCQDCFSVLVL
jgi:hypothetical protein